MKNRNLCSIVITRKQATEREKDERDVNQSAGAMYHALSSPNLDKR